MEVDSRWCVVPQSSQYTICSAQMDVPRNDN